jgi:hypothetical protein
MRSKVSPGPGQDPVDAELVDVRDSKEQWNIYELADGTVLRLKPVVSEIWRIIGAHDAEGNPQYLTKATIVTALTVRDDLRKPK